MNTIVRLHQISDKYVIIDDNENIIIENIHDADECFLSEDDMIIRFMTDKNEYSYINSSSGLFFDKFSYKEYDIVCEIIPFSQIYKATKNGKYGLINANSNDDRTINCIFDELEFIRSNVFTGDDIVKLKKDSKYSLIHVLRKQNESRKYDYIYTPIQPVTWFIVCNNGKYGFIDVDSLEELVEPTFETIENLCKKFNYDIDKYIQDIYLTDTTLKLKRVPVPNQCRSYIIDANKIVKGKWGGNGELITDNRTGEVYVHYLYYSPKSIRLPINMYGYFYNLFDCRKYDVVIHAIKNFYLVIKGKKYGLMDDEFHTILDISYKDIRLVHFSQLKGIPLFVVTCKKGQFLYNAETGLQTRVFDSLAYHDDSYVSGCYRNYLVYEEHGKFGILSPEGNVVIKAKFDLYKISFGERDRIEQGHAYFQEIFHNHKYGFYIENNKFYNKVPVDKYDSCIRIGDKILDNYYITKSQGKYGLLNHQCCEVDIPPLDDMFFPESPMTPIFGIFAAGNRHLNKPISEKFLIGLKENKYNLYSIASLTRSQEAKLIVSDCEEMEFIGNESEFRKEYPYVRFKKNGKEGYVNEDGIVISLETFDKINPIEVSEHEICYYLICKEGKIGLLNDRKKILLPCIYDNIQHVTPWSALVTEDKTEKEVKYNNATTSRDDDSFDMLEELHHYSEYAGSYAQDVMGYSDEDIDTIFDGDPDAYWNID